MVKKDNILNDEEKALLNIFSIKFRGRTKYDYNREITAFKLFVKKDILDVHSEDAINYIDMLIKDEQKSSSTKQRIYYQLLSFYNFLSERKLIETNPFWKVEKPQASKQIKKERTPTFEQIEKLFNVLAGHFSLRDLALVSVIATTGLRISEVLNLKWSDFLIDAKDNIGFKVQQGEHFRYIRVLNSVWNLLNKYRKEFLNVNDSYLKQPFYVFINANQLNNYITSPEGVRPLTQAAVRNLLVDACNKAGIPVFTSKDLRHAHAIFALKLGANVEEVKEQLNWSSTNLIYRYNGVMEQIETPANVYTEKFFEGIIKV